MSDNNIIELDKAFCASRINKLYLNEAMSDVHFVFNTDGDQQQLVLVPANKTILAASSLVFHAMFYGNLKEESVVQIIDATADAFKEFLQFFYLAEVKLTIENIAEVMNLLNKYDLFEQVNVCEEFLMKNLTVDNIFMALKLAITFDRKNLKKFCAEEIGVSSKKIFASDAFRQCSRDILKLILQMETFSCFENQIFDACMTWAENACVKNNLDISAVNCRKQLGDCLYLIQFEKMTSYEVQKHISKYMELFNKNELVELFKIFTSELQVKQIFQSVNRIYIDNKPFNESGCNTIDIKLKMGKMPKDKYWMPQQESLFFQVNKRLLLGALSFYFYSNVEGDYKLKGVMTIRKLSLDTKNDDNILRKETNIFNCSYLSPGPHYLKLSETLSVTPNCPYEIRFNFSNWRDEMFISFKSSSLVRKDEYRIFFAQYTTAENEVMSKRSSNSTGLRFLWIPGKKKHQHKGRYDTTNKGNSHSSHQQKKLEPWSLGGSKGHSELIKSEDMMGESSGAMIKSSIDVVGGASAVNMSLHASEQLNGNAPTQPIDLDHDVHNTSTLLARIWIQLNASMIIKAIKWMPQNYLI